MISVKTVSPEIKSMAFSFIKIFIILISFITFLNLSKVKAKYEKGKISVPGELILHSHHTRWFSTTNDLLICIFRVLKEVLAEKLVKGLPLKLNSAIFGSISSNRKLNLKSPLFRKRKMVVILFVSDRRFNHTRNHLRLSD